MGCSGSKAKSAEVQQPVASATLLDPATGKPADTFAEIKATVAKLTAEELSASIKELSPKVVSKIQAAFAVVAKQQEERAAAEAPPAAEAADVQNPQGAKAKQQEERAIAEAAPAADAEDDQTTEDAKAATAEDKATAELSAEAAPALEAAHEQTVEEAKAGTATGTPTEQVLEVPAAASSKTLCCF